MDDRAATVVVQQSLYLSKSSGVPVQFHTGLVGLEYSSHLISHDSLAVVVDAWRTL